MHFENVRFQTLNLDLLAPLARGNCRFVAVGSLLKILRLFDKFALDELLPFATAINLDHLSDERRSFPATSERLVNRDVSVH